jgi:hypothetical protein
MSSFAGALWLFAVDGTSTSTLARPRGQSSVSSFHIVDDIVRSGDDIDDDHASRGDESLARASKASLAAEARRPVSRQSLARR